jgi:glycosyltransferase involved in cell wall biosynthesis
VKNIDNIIVACSRLKVPLHLYYGGGNLEGHLRKLAAEIGAVVEFKGSVPNEELLRIHHNHSIFVLCSLREGMPKAMIEAMASGLICVGTRTDGVSELIENGKTGYLAGGFDADAIEAALAVALREMNSQIGWNAREFVIKNHSLEYAVDVELDILKKIIASARAADRLNSEETRKSRAPTERPTN